MASGNVKIGQCPNHINFAAIHNQPDFLESELFFDHQSLVLAKAASAFGEPKRFAASVQVALGQLPTLLHIHNPGGAGHGPGRRMQTYWAEELSAFEDKKQSFRLFVKGGHLV